MKLLSLTCNQPSFKPIYFNRRGLSFIVGRQKNPEQSNNLQTYNGVGKSLSIYLIHFCLGASKNESLEINLPDWEFTLVFEIDGIKYTSVRNTSKQNRISLNDKSLTVKKFNEELEQLVFELEEPVKWLKFRPLIKRFIRPSRESYLSYASVRSGSRQYEDLLVNAFLLGLNIDIIQTKHDLKAELDGHKDSKKRIKNDPIFVEYFGQKKNPDIELLDLQEEISRLEQELQAFQVAENYYEIEQLANEKKQELQAKKNEAILINNAIDNINISLQEQPDISLQKVIDVYNATSEKLPHGVVKDLDEVTSFHQNLISNRIQRLSSEKSRLTKDLDKTNEDIETLSKEVNDFIAYLGTHGALDELVQLTSYINGLKGKAQKILDFKEFQNSYDNKVQETKTKIGLENIRTSEYLQESQKLLNDNIDTFRDFSRQFYEKKPGGLTVSNNTGENKIRFSIDAEIEDDTSDGINEVKIFCFDMTLLSRKQNHDVQFLVHDSRLYSNMDPRQRSTLFRVVDEYTRKHDAQYIATINQSQIDSVRELLSEEEFNRIFSDTNVILTLTDDGEDGKLLGKQVNLKYE